MTHRTSDSAAVQHNRRAWDAMVGRQHHFTRPARDEDFADPLRRIDGLGWLGPSLRRRKVLCLAAGGGKYGPLCAAADAEVTVVDVSPAMLELDRQVAAERGLQLRTIETSMDDLSMFSKEEFEIVIHPVSTCYVPSVEPVYLQIARVTRVEGIYVSQHKQPVSLQVSDSCSPPGYELSEPYYRNGPLPAVAGSLHREDRTLEYLHRWEELVGLMCRAGFVVEDLAEPCHGQHDASTGSFSHRSRYVAPYVCIKARRVDRRRDPLEQPRLVLT